MIDKEEIVMNIEAVEPLNEVQGALEAKGYTGEEIQKMSFEEIVNKLYHPTFRIDIENKYDAPILYSSGKIINNDYSYMYILPNGTLVITDPKIAKFVEKQIIHLTTRYSEPSNPFYVTRNKGPWNEDRECIDYAQSILSKREKNK